MRDFDEYDTINYDAIEDMLERRMREIEEVRHDHESTLKAMEESIKEQKMREAAEESAKLDDDLFKI
jgi:hypothetical protein